MKIQVTKRMAAGDESLRSRGIPGSDGASIAQNIASSQSSAEDWMCSNSMAEPKSSNEPKVGLIHSRFPTNGSGSSTRTPLSRLWRSLA